MSQTGGQGEEGDVTAADQLGFGGRPQGSRRSFIAGESNLELTLDGVEKDPTYTSILTLAIPIEQAISFTYLCAGP